MPFAVDRRPLKPGEENDLWKFVYDNAVAEKHYPSLFELFKAYQLQGHLQNYGLTEVEFHFHKRMLRNLYKTDGLKPSEILTTYHHFRIPIDTDVRKILHILGDGVAIRCNKASELQSWKFQRRRSDIQRPQRNRKTGDSIPRRKRQLNGYLQVRMWKHITENMEKIKQTEILTRKFWSKMKLRWKHCRVTPAMLAKYFDETLRHCLYYLKMDPESKARLIRHLQMKPTRAQLLWMLRVDKIFVDVGTSGLVRSWSFLKNRRSQVQMRPLESYVPLKQYEPRPYFFYECRKRYEAMLGNYKGLKEDTDGIIRIPTWKQRERDREEYSEYMEFVKETKKKLNPGALMMTEALAVMRRVLTDEEAQKMCDRVLMCLETEWLQAAMQKVLNILETMNPDIPNPKLKKIFIHKCFERFADDEDVEGYEAGDEVYENHDERDTTPLNFYWFAPPLDFFIGDEDAYWEFKAWKDAERAKKKEEARRSEPRRAKKLRSGGIRRRADGEDDVLEVLEEEDSEDVEEAEEKERENSDQKESIDGDDEKNASEASEASVGDEDVVEVVVLSSDTEMEEEIEFQPSPPSAPPSPIPSPPTPPRQESELIDVETVSSNEEPMARRLNPQSSSSSSQEADLPIVVYEEPDNYELMLLEGMSDGEWQRIDARLSQQEEEEEMLAEQQELYYYEEEEVEFSMIPEEDIPSTSQPAAPPKKVVVKKEPKPVNLSRRSSRPTPEQKQRRQEVYEMIKAQILAITKAFGASKSSEPQPTRKSSRIAANHPRYRQKPEVEQEEPPEMWIGTKDRKGVYSFDSLKFFVGKDGIAQKVLPAPTEYVYEKIISDATDIVKYYAQLDKPPISFADGGISFVRDGAKFEVKLAYKSKETIQRERGRKENKISKSHLQMLHKRRAMSPLSSTSSTQQSSSVKSRRMSSTRHYSPSSSRISNDDVDIPTCVLFEKHRGIFPIVSQLNIPDFQ